MTIREQFAWLSYKDIEMLEKLKVAFDAVSDHVVITDKDGNILYANSAVEKMTGFPLKETIGKNPADLWGGNMPKEFYENMWHTIKTEKKPFVGEVQNKKKDGTFYWQEVHISPVLDEAGEVKFFIGIEPNITDRKGREKFSEEFVSILAHQLKNPLTTIRWALESVFGSGRLTLQDRQALQEIYKENRSLIDLISDLLLVARVQDVGAEPVEFDLAEEIRTIGERLSKANPEVMFRFEKKGDQFALKVNKSLALQAFQNLITNAFEYADKQAPQVILTVSQEKERCLFSCENNGLSIPKGEQPKIFSKFFRASNAQQAKENGTGLGLFIVKTICDFLGWTVSFQSPRAEGDGTIFYVAIPR